MAVGNPASHTDNTDKCQKQMSTIGSFKQPLQRPFSRPVQFCWFEWQFRNMKEIEHIFCFFQIHEFPLTKSQFVQVTNPPPTLGPPIDSIPFSRTPMTLGPSTKAARGRAPMNDMIVITEYKLGAFMFSPVITKNTRNKSNVRVQAGVNTR